MTEIYNKIRRRFGNRGTQNSEGLAAMTMPSSILSIKLFLRQCTIKFKDTYIRSF